MHDQIREHMEIIGADGVHLGTVDKVEGDRIKLTKADAGVGSHEGHHHLIALALVAGVEDDRVRLSANADVAFAMEEEEDGEDRDAAFGHDDDAEAAYDGALASDAAQETDTGQAPIGGERL